MAKTPYGSQVGTLERRVKFRSGALDRIVDCLELRSERVADLGVGAAIEPQGENRQFETRSAAHDHGAHASQRLEGDNDIGWIVVCRCKLRTEGAWDSVVRDIERDVEVQRFMFATGRRTNRGEDLAADAHRRERAEACAQGGAEIPC